MKTEYERDLREMEDLLLWVLDNTEQMPPSMGREFCRRMEVMMGLEPWQEAPSATLPPGHTDEAACMPSQSTISPPGDSPPSTDP